MSVYYGQTENDVYLSPLESVASFSMLSEPNEALSFFIGRMKGRPG